MRRPLPTTRRLLLLVALVGLGLGLVAWMQRRSSGFRRLAAAHDRSFAGSEGHSSVKNEWILEMWEKYGQAAKRLWLPVVADPAEPE